LKNVWKITKSALGALYPDPHKRVVMLL